MTGKIVLITGANSGIGFEAAVRIARMGAQVVMVARDRQKAETAIVAARERSGSDKFSLMLCDMSSMSGVRRLAADVLATKRQARRQRSAPSGRSHLQPRLLEIPDRPARLRVLRQNRAGLKGGLHDDGR